jgi:hypothetical protein
MHVIPTHRQSQPHQMGSMWTASKISAASSTVASLQPPPPMKEPPQMRYSPASFLLAARDKRRIPRHDNGVAIRIGGGHKTRFESVRQLEDTSSTTWLTAPRCSALSASSSTGDGCRNGGSATSLIFRLQFNLLVYRFDNGFCRRVGPCLCLATSPAAV